MKIPIIAPVDTNCDPDLVQFPFPGNYDAIRAIGYYCTKISEAIKQGRKKYEEGRRILEESGELSTQEQAPQSQENTQV